MTIIIMIIALIIAMMIMAIKIILTIVVVVMINSPFQPDNFWTGSTTDHDLKNQKWPYQHRVT